MPVPVGLNVWSRLVEELFPYLDQTVAPFESLWFPDHVQYGANKVAEGWTLLAFALARYPDKFCTHEVLCNSFRNPAHLPRWPPPRRRSRVDGSSWASGRAGTKRSIAPTAGRFPPRRFASPSSAKPSS